MKENRNINETNESLDILMKMAKNNENLVPQVINAIKSNATLGEISDTLRNVFGQY